ncbi:MAG: HAMP domain-containing protein [Sandaracinaceae bacterium]|nr:HAMP domain-containing protein [Sandaracinaceae bacterium]
MTAETQSVPKQGGGAPPKRRLRNFLLDPGFQLKYTGMVVLVTAIVTGGVGAWLGYEAYNYSRGMSEMLLMQQGGAMELDDGLQRLLEAESQEEDARVLRQITVGIVVLVVVLSLALGVTGIVITHRIVGPAYKLKLLLGDVARGRLNVRGGLRKGDELQDVGEAFQQMVKALRDRQEEEIAELEAILERAGDEGVDDEVVAKITALRDRMRAALEV